MFKRMVVFIILIGSFTINAQEKEKLEDLKPLVKPDDIKDKKKSEANHDFTVNQFMANDVNFRGTSIFGEKLSRRNLQEYQSFANSWLVSTNVTFNLPLTGLKFIFTSHNSIENRADKDSDLRLQSISGGDDQTAKVNQYLQGGNLNFDPNAVKSRKEHNGLRDVFLSQMLYDWETRLGGFRTGLFLLNNQNYPTKTNVGEWIFGWRLPFANAINPEIISFHRFTSEVNGLNNGNIHLRGTIKHEFVKDDFYKFIPILEVGYQSANNTTDKRVGFTDVTLKLQVFIGNFFLGLNGTHRPNVYMYDNDRNYPKIGAYTNANDNDGKIVDPSKTAGIQNRLVLDSIAQSNTHEVVKQMLTRNFQEQNIVKNIFIVNIGYSVKF
jgi:hypothetical protein